MSDRPIVCVDLDGVLNLFDGWKGPEHFHPPRPGAHSFLRSLRELNFEVVIFTVRWAPHVELWLAAHGLAELVDRVTDRKPPAKVFIDDRAICFEGDFTATLERLASFRPHWEEHIVTDKPHQS